MGFTGIPVSLLPSDPTGNKSLPLTVISRKVSSPKAQVFPPHPGLLQLPLQAWTPRGEARLEKQVAAPLGLAPTALSTSRSLLGVDQEG